MHRELDASRADAVVIVNGVARTASQIAWSRSVWLLAAAGILWAALLGPAWLVAGSNGLIGVSCAAVLCVIPGWIVFWMAAAYGAAGGQVPLVILGGTTLRLIFVLLGMVIVQTVWQQMGFREFVVWLLVFYLSTLAVETFLVLLPLSKGREPRQAGGA